MSKLSEPCKHGTMLRHLCSDCLLERLAHVERERDTARQMESMWRGREHTATAERDAARTWAERAEGQCQAALAKAGAAEKQAEAISIDNMSARQQILDLRARIKALAVEWEKEGWSGFSEGLRALLQPPKAETALDVCAKIERMAREGGDQGIEAEAGKLRKLLTEEEGK